MVKDGEVEGGCMVGEGESKEVEGGCVMKEGSCEEVEGMDKLDCMEEEGGCMVEGRG